MVVIGKEGMDLEALLECRIPIPEMIGKRRCYPHQTLPSVGLVVLADHPAYDGIVDALKG